MTKLSELHDRWMRDPDYAKAYEATELEYALAEQLIAARIHSGMTQGELAQRMGTSQSAIARLESGRVTPSMRTLKRVAQATNSQLRISFTPG